MRGAGKSPSHAMFSHFLCVAIRNAHHCRGFTSRLTMNEAKWRECKEPDEMLAFLHRFANSRNRKLRLFCCACTRRVWYRLTRAVASRRAVDRAERFADGTITSDELAEASAAIEPELRATPVGKPLNAIRAADCCVSQEMNALGVARSVSWATTFASRIEKGIERLTQASLLRDIFGNPFCPIVFSPAWRTDTVLSLARQMYEAREFGAMPILADALQDAGCDNTDILSHCRDLAQRHIRGCWVVDLVLDRS